MPRARQAGNPACGCRACARLRRMTSRLGRMEAPGATAAPSRGRQGPERIPVEVSQTHAAIARAIAGRIAAIVRERHAAGGAVLGLATGSTPIGIYRELIRLHRDE